MTDIYSLKNMFMLRHVSWQRETYLTISLMT